jgi:tetratricopeptide (TPR) repeat protein
LAALLLVSASIAAAQPSAESAVEVARRHYQAGLAAYEQGNYADAMAEFAAARENFHAPELEYNLARCHERLEHFGEAADAYERYLAARPGADDATEIHARVAVLRARAGERPAAPVEKPSRAAPLAVAAIALALAAGSGALYGWAVADYQARAGQCQHMCDPSSLGDFRAHVLGLEASSLVLVGVAAALVAVDVVLWLRARSPEPARAARAEWRF